MSDENTHDHLYELLAGFKTAMVTTRKADGALHCRPMAVAELTPGAEATFATSLDSPKIAEIEGDARITVTFQNSSEFASIAGKAEIIRDRAEIKRLWSEAWRAWFPKGQEDPSLCLVKVRASEAEYWDNSGLEGFKYLFEGAKAIFQGRKARVDAAQHAKLRL